MPIYEYKCATCGDVFEVMQRFSDAPLSVHEGCGGAVNRLVSAAALRFKGSGWYITDYAKSGGGSKNGEPAKGSEAKSSESKSAEAASASTKTSETKSSAPASGSEK